MNFNAKLWMLGEKLPSWAMRKLALSIWALCMVIFVGGVAGAEVTMVQLQDNGKEIRVKAGEVIELNLQAGAGTGYSWEFHGLDESRFKVLHTETRPLADPNRVGGPMLQVWRLKTLTPGETKLSLDYLRPWEGRVKAVKHFEVKVRIH